MCGNGYVDGGEAGGFIEQLILGGIPYTLQLLSAADALECLRTAALFQERLSLPDGIVYLSETLAEYGALCAFCLFREGQKAFKSPEEALRTLTLDELCDVYDSYRILNGDEETG